MKLSQTAIENELLELIQNALIREPQAPAVRIAQEAIQEAPGPTIKQLSDILVQRHVATLVRRQRKRDAKTAEKNQPLLFPQWEALPRHVRTEHGTGSRTSLRDATLAELKAHLRFLERHPPHIQRQIDQLRELIQFIQTRRYFIRGMTVGEVLERERSAGR